MKNDNLKCVGYRGAGCIRQTAKAPVDLRICEGFAINVDGSVDGFVGGDITKYDFLFF